jgi:hypothetical protein
MTETLDQMAARTMHRLQEVAYLECVRKGRVDQNLAWHSEQR